MAHVVPPWVDGFDKGDLLGARPSLELLLAGDGVGDELVAFRVDEAVCAVKGRVRIGVVGGSVLVNAAQ